MIFLGEKSLLFFVGCVIEHSPQSDNTLTHGIGESVNIFFLAARVIGERVSVRELYGDKPTFTQLDAATKLLYEREEELARFLDTIKK